MTVMILKYPVYSISGDLIVPMGTVINSENISRIISSHSKSFDQAPLIHYKNIKSDIVSLLKQKPYDAVFNPELTDHILDLMDMIVLPLPVIESIYFFKSYDFYTYRHFLMVMTLTTLISNEILKDKDELLRNMKAGSSHDIGKICLPSWILNKKTALSVTEKNDLKQHTVMGYLLIRYYFNTREEYVALAALNHHERTDGSGYPFQIKREDPVSDIIIVSDIFDALISSRPYRPTPYDTRSALDEITGMALHNKISLDVVKALVNYVRGNKIHYSQCDVSRDRRGSPPLDNLYDTTIEPD